MRVIAQAIIVGSVDYGDSDRVLTLFTRELGKVSAIASGARKSHKRFGAAAQTFGVGEAVLRRRPQAELYVLESFAAHRNFGHLFDDVVRVAHASYACELVRELCPPASAEPAVFALLDETLDLIGQGEEALHGAPLRVFELRLLTALGHQTALDGCTQCGDEDGPFRLVPHHGGLVCAGCGTGGLPLAAPTLALLRRAQTASPRAAVDWATSAEVAHEARQATTALLGEQLTRPLKSLEFISKMNHRPAARP